MAGYEQNSKAGNLPRNRNPKEYELAVLTMQLLCCHNISVFPFDNGDNTFLSKGSNDVLHVRYETVINVNCESKFQHKEMNENYRYPLEVG